MAEATAAESNEGTAPTPRRPRRKHTINLCCAQSVQEHVEEVARNLRDLGFTVRVVFGAKARAALLGSKADSATPMIHVVCVQGSLQERVLKPLRQALATHGADNHHLFVAVLDLAVPLAMVGQIRRFAEALERPDAGKMVDAADRGQRRPTTRELEQGATRNFPAVTQVVERPGTRPPPGSGSEDGERPRRRAKSLTSRARAAKIGPTSKYRAVTASHAAVPVAESGGSRVRKRRRGRSRLNPGAGRRGSGRVLGLPEAQPSKPPPPPAPGEMARRRSSTTMRAVGDGPPPPPPPKSKDKPEPDAPKRRYDPKLRFTPPASKSGPMASKMSGHYATVPLAESLSDEPDPPEDIEQTRVEGMSAPAPRTESTLKLDEPPFKENKPDISTSRYGQDELRASIASVSKPEPDADAPVQTSHATSSGSMVAPEMGDPSASTSGTVHAPTGPQLLTPERPAKKTVLYQESIDEEAAAESSGDDDGDGDGDEEVSETSKTLMPSSRPGGAGEDEIAESDKTVMLADGGFPDAAALSDSAVRPVVRLDSEEVELKSPRRPDERKSTVFYGEEPDDDGDDIEAPEETDKTVVMQASLTGDASSDDDDDDEPDTQEETVVDAKAPSEDTVVGASSSRNEGTVVDGVALPPDEQHEETVVDAKAPTSEDSDEPDEDDDDAMAVAPVTGKTVVPTDSTDGESDDGDEPAEAAASDDDGEVSETATTRKPESQLPTEPHTHLGAVEAARGDAPGQDDEDSSVFEDRPTRRRIPPQFPDPARAAGVNKTKVTSSGTIAAKGPEAQPEQERSGSGLIWLVLLFVVIGGGGYAAYQAGLFGPGASKSGAGTVAARDSAKDPGKSKDSAGEAAASAGTKAAADGGKAAAADGADADTPKPAADDAAEPADDGAPADANAGSTGSAAAADAGADDAAEPDAGTTGTAEAADAGAADDTAEAPAAADDGATEVPAEPETPAEPEPPAPEPEPAVTPPAPEPSLDGDEQVLAKAADERRIVMLKTLFASRRQGGSTTWGGGGRRCSEFEVDGVRGWRLPHRREMKLLNAVLPLPGGIYWTKTVPKDDRQAAYVLDTATGGLSLFLKQEPTGEVICVRRRAKSKK